MVNRVLLRGFLAGMLVLLGGLVVSALPRSSHPMRSSLLVALRDAEAGRMAGLAVVLLGLGLLAGQWLALCRHVAQVPTEERDDALALVRHAAVVWSAPLLLAPPLFSRDGWSYAAQGMLAHLGLSPYDHGPGVLSGPILQAVDPRWRETPAPYGPVSLFFGDVVAGTTGNPWMLVVAHRCLALLGLTMLAWALPRLARRTGANPALASALVLLSPLMLAHGVGGLHNDLLMVGLMAVALVVGLEHSWAAGCLLGGLAAAVKLPGGLVCLAIVLASLPAAAGLVERVRRLGAGAVLAVAALVGAGVVSGLGSGWVHGLSVPGTVVTPLSPVPMLGGALDWTAGRLLDLAPATFLDLARLLGMVATVVVLGVVALRWRTGEATEAVRALALVTGVTVLLGPVVHLWYLLWVVPFVALLRLPRLGSAALMAVSVLAGLVAPLDSSLHGAYLAIVLGAMLVAALTPVLLLTRRARSRLERIAAARWLPVEPVEPVEPPGSAGSAGSGDVATGGERGAELVVHGEHPRDRG